MKTKFTLLLIFCMFLNLSIGQKADPMQALNQALKVSIKEDKNIFILFYEDNCEGCKLFKTTLENPMIAGELKDNFTFCFLKVDNKNTRDVLIELSGKKSGLPFFAIMNQEAVVITDSRSRFGTNIGYPMEEHSKELLRERIINNAKRLSVEQIDKWRETLFN